jgi:hypothetical protein
LVSLINQGNRSFDLAGPKTGLEMGSVAAGNLDADSFGDLVGLTAGFDVQTAFGGLDGAFSDGAALDYDANFMDIWSGAMDADMRDDVVVWSAMQSEGHVFITQGGGVLSKTASFSSQDGATLVVGDFDGGATDVVVLGDHIDLYPGDGSGALGDVITSQHASDTNIGAAGDFDGDDKLDLVAVGGNGDEAVFRLGDGFGAFGLTRTVQYGGGGGGLAVGHLDGDDIVDVAIINFGSSAVHVLLSEG